MCLLKVLATSDCKQKKDIEVLANVPANIPDPARDFWCFLKFDPSFSLITIHNIGYIRKYEFSSVTGFINSWFW